MTHLVTRSQLARVTSFAHRFSKPLLTVTISCSQTLSYAQCSTKTASSVDSDRRLAALPEDLSKNVVFLSCESSAKGGVCDVYVVGTSHVSEESARQVQGVVKFLKPQVVFLELCSSRAKILTRTEPPEVPTTEQMIAMLEKGKNIVGVVHSWYLAQMGSHLGVIPGSEFRVAYEEAIKYGGRVAIGDRPQQITLQRLTGAWREMPLWHKMDFILFILRKSYKILKEMEDYDDKIDLAIVLKDIIRKKSPTSVKTFQEMSDKFPTLVGTMVDERDQIMSSRILQVASKSSSVVAVVGMGHLQGIKKHWKQPVAIEELMKVPSPKPPKSALRSFTSVGVAAVGVAIISSFFLSRGGV